jgi:hypothetical protein
LKEEFNQTLENVQNSQQGFFIENLFDQENSLAI